MIIALAGRRIDAPNAEIRRFPPENLELVRTRIRSVLQAKPAALLISSAACGSDLIALEEALDTLAHFDPRKAKVIEMRFFGGLSVEETAEVLKISPETVMRDWKLARAWLMREMAGR